MPTRRLLFATVLLSALACSTSAPSVTVQRPMASPAPPPRAAGIVGGSERKRHAADTDVTPAPAPGSTTPRPEELALLWPLDRGLGVVLDRGDIATRGPVRKISASQSPGDFALEKDVSESALAGFEGMRGRVLDLYGKDGVECTATVSGFRAVGGFTLWDEHEPSDAVWDSLADRYLVAVVEPVSPACQPLWARARDLPKPTVLAPRELTATESRRAARALGKTAVVRSIQASYLQHRNEAREPDGPATWQALEPREWHAVTFEHPSEPFAYVSVALSAGDSCGEFGGQALGFFKADSGTLLDVTGDGALELPGHPVFGLVPATAVVLEPGGPVYFIHPNALYTNTGAGVAPVMTVERTGTTCGC